MSHRKGTHSDAWQCLTVQEKGDVTSALENVDVSMFSLPQEGAKRILFASDLDHTILASARHLSDDDIKDARVVETYQHKPLSVMTGTSLSMLQLLRQYATFVPITSRDTYAFNRLDIGYDMAVVTNGGKLVDIQGNIRDIANRDSRVPHMLRVLQNLTSDWKCVKKISSIDGFFAVIKVEEISTDEVSKICDVIHQEGFTFSRQAKKIYAIPNGLSKRHGLEYVQRTLKPDFVISAGDSMLDYPMKHASDVFLTPQGGEIHMNKSHHPVGDATLSSLDSAQFIIATALKIALLLHDR